MSRYTVMVDDNFHYMDESERTVYGIFEDAEAALAACRRIVDASLRHLYEPGMDATRLSAQYCSFGDDPFILALDGAEPVPFSGRDYAQQRSAAICAERA